jgi:hypothetical protein
MPKISICRRWHYKRLTDFPSQLLPNAAVTLSSN